MMGKIILMSRVKASDERSSLMLPSDVVSLRAACYPPLQLLDRRCQIEAYNLATSALVRRKRGFNRRNIICASE
jgi:hypothetical protein